MIGRRTWLFVCLLIAALPLAAHERKVTLVMIDVEANRAYIPEGTVLPPGLSLRTEKTVLDRETFEVLRANASREGRAMQRATKTRLEAKPPLIFEYAPADRFDAIRKNYEAYVAKRRSRVQTNSHQFCWDTYSEATQQGVYGQYAAAFVSTYCWPSSSTVVGQAYEHEFRAEGEYSDKDWTISPRVWVDDLNGNFNCYDEWDYPGDTGQCSASATTVLGNTSCLNEIDVGSLQYVIEYLDGYIENYLGFNFLHQYCVQFY